MLPQPPSGEGVAGTGFQVPLKRGGLIFVGKRQVGDKLPRPELGGVRRFSGIVVREALLQVFGAADVSMITGLLALEQIDVMHRATLLRRGFGGHPASRLRGLQILRSALARSRMVEPDGIEPTTSTMPLHRIASQINGITLQQ
ncbi:MAG: hypothetical protein ABJV68_23670 [Paracoccaceae bacterium]